MTFSTFVEESDAAQTHKQLMQHKLRTMLGWCELTSCRRQALLRYFDEQTENNCGNCDNCLAPPAVFDNTENARRALSCVYRTGQRFGVNYLIEVLQGKTKDPRICQYHHDQLELFGTGSEVDARQWRDLFRQLIAAGYLVLDDEGHGSLQLDDSCRPVLKGEQCVMQRKQTRSPTKTKKANSELLDPADQHLFDALRAVRADLARENGIPPYVIFHDATLIALSTHKPSEIQELTGISGIGQTKQERYGEAFLRVIRQYI
jgi:ATP-dependent DNA helicase RecQ